MALLTLASGLLYQHLGGIAFWIMAALCVLAIPVAMTVRMPESLVSVMCSTPPNALAEVVEMPLRNTPRWRGYEYFVYNDEIILVDPRTHGIVAILPCDLVI